MKKTLLLLMMTGILHSLFAQSSPGKLPEEGEPCPKYCPTTQTASISQVNFHKPRTNCSSGFGFCVKVTITEHCACDAEERTPGIRNGMVTLIAKIVGKKLNLYIPSTLKELDEYKNQSMDTFTIDNGITLVNKSGASIGNLKAGEYSVTTEGENFLVVIDML